MFFEKFNSLVFYIAIFYTAIGWAQDPWHSIDSFQYISPRSGQASTMTVTKSGRFLVAGHGGAGGRQGNGFEDVWIVRRSLDQGNTWQNVDEYQLAQGYQSEPISMTSLGEKIFVLGKVYDQELNMHIVVRRSLDGGSNWETCLDRVDVNSSYWFEWQIVNDGNRLYLLFQRNGSSFKSDILVSEDYAKTWVNLNITPADNGIEKKFYVDNAKAFYLTSEFYDPKLKKTKFILDAGLGYLNNELFLFASKNLSESALWLSDDLGTSWSEVDNQDRYSIMSAKVAANKAYFLGNDFYNQWGVFQIKNSTSNKLETTDSYGVEGSSAQGNAITTGTDGTIIAAGSGLDKKNNYHALIRRSADQGKNWETVDDYSSTVKDVFDGQKYENIISMGANTFIATGSSELSKRPKVFIRSSENNGLTWAPFAEFPDELYGVSAIDPKGRVYIASRDQSSSTLIIRRIDDNGKTLKEIFRKKDVEHLRINQIEFLSDGNFIMNLDNEILYMAVESNDSISITPIVLSQIHTMTLLAVDRQDAIYLVDLNREWGFDLYASYDLGKTWLFKSQIKPQNFDDFWITDLLVLPNGDFIASGYDDGIKSRTGMILKSSDGINWSIEWQKKGLGHLEVSTAWKLSFDNKGSVFAIGQNASPRGGDWLTLFRPNLQ